MHTKGTFLRRSHYLTGSSLLPSGIKQNFRYSSVHTFRDYNEKSSTCVCQGTFYKGAPDPCKRIPRVPALRRRSGCTRLFHFNLVTPEIYHHLRDINRHICYIRCPYHFQIQKRYLNIHFLGKTENLLKL